MTERDVDEVDLILIPAARALIEFRLFMEQLGLSPKHQLQVLRERLPIARAIIHQGNDTRH